MNWYPIITNDLARLPDCLEYFEDELLEARAELSMTAKKLEHYGGELPGLVEYRFNQLQELEAILEYLNIQLRKTQTEQFKKFLETYAKQLSSRDAEKYAAGTSEVIDMQIIVNELALMRNKFLGISKGLDQKSWMIGHITRLRVAGLDDAMLN